MPNNNHEPMWLVSMAVDVSSAVPLLLLANLRSLPVLTVARLPFHSVLESVRISIFCSHSDSRTVGTSIPFLVTLGTIHFFLPSSHHALPFSMPAALPLLLAPIPCLLRTL